MENRRAHPLVRKRVMVYQKSGYIIGNHCCAFGVMSRGSCAFSVPLGERTIDAERPEAPDAIRTNSDLALQQAYTVLQVGYKRRIMQFIRKKIEGDS